MDFPSDDFRKGYAAAMGVLNAATVNANHSDPAAAMRVSRRMLMDGLDEGEASLQRRDYFEKDRVAQQANVTAHPSGNGKVVRPSVQAAEQFESLASVNARWVREMSGEAGSAQQGQVLKVELR